MPEIQNNNHIDAASEITFSFDISLIYTSPDKSVSYAALFGWIRMPAGTRLFLCDRQGKNPALLHAFSWPREDIDDIYGPCINMEQQGYGWVGMAEINSCQVSSMLLIAYVDGEMKNLGNISSRRCFHPSTLLEQIFTMPIPWPYVRGAYATVIAPIMHKIWAVYNNCLKIVPVSDITIGTPAQDNGVSIICSVPDKPELFTSQFLILSELADSCSGLEIIFTFSGSKKITAFLEQAESLRKVTRMSFRYIHSRHLAHQIENFNLAATNSKGDKLLFMDSEYSLAFNTPLLKIMEALQAEAISMIPAILLDYNARVWIDNSTGGDSGARELFSSRPCQNICEDSFTGAFAIRKSDYQKYGGLQPGHPTIAGAYSQLVQRLGRDGKTVLYLPDFYAASIDNSNREQWDILKRQAIYEDILLQ